MHCNPFPKEHLTVSFEPAPSNAPVNPRRYLRIGFVCIVAILFGHPVVAARAATLQEVVQEAILDNPEVQERWDAFIASGYEQRRARGGYYPQIDLRSRIGKEWFDTDAGDSQLNPAEASLELTQLLYDGFATRNEVRKFGHLRLARYYELLSISETIALEVSRAYLDVLRFRELLQLAEDNYQLHVIIHQQVKERVEAGIGRGVDLEQATGRLALADSNRITEATNLHDVRARYLRLVGTVPPPQLSAEIPFADALPVDMPEALRLAFAENPGFLATTENLRAADADYRIRKAAYQPRLEFRARHDIGSDRSSINDQSEESVVELVMNYNLFRGGADAATISQFASLRNQARDQQIKTCRDVRQTLDIAFNDVERLKKQLIQLETHKTSIANARQAYRDQFDIGQRTLLDLLDTENEYFQASRAYTNAAYDVLLAQVRTIAQTGQLLTRLDIRQKGLPQPGKLDPDVQPVDPDSICPPIEVLQPELRVRELPKSAVETPLELQRPQTAPLVTVVPTPQPKMILEKRLDIRFPTDQAQIPKEYLDEIRQLAEVMQQFPETSITLGGHTDSTGKDPYNLKLSRSRADAVRNRLIYGHGIDPGRVLITWFSSAQPKADNASEAGRMKNRRTEAQISLIIQDLSSLATKQRDATPAAPPVER